MLQNDFSEHHTTIPGQDIIYQKTQVRRTILLGIYISDSFLTMLLTYHMLGNFALIFVVSLFFPKHHTTIPAISWSRHNLSENPGAQNFFLLGIYISDSFLTMFFFTNHMLGNFALIFVVCYFFFKINFSENSF